MVRRMMILLAAASISGTLALPLSSSGAQAARSAPGQHAAPGSLRQLGGSCSGCLGGVLRGSVDQGAPWAVSSRTGKGVHHTHAHVAHHSAGRRRQARGLGVARPRHGAVRRPVRQAATGPFGWGTKVLRGSMTSRSEVRMTAAFSVGHAKSLDWNLPRPTSIQLNGFLQVVQAIQFHFSVIPASWIDTTVDGHPVRRFHWENPPAETVINVVETLHVLTQASLSPFASRAGYPLARVPAEAQPYLAVTPLVRLPAWATGFTRSLARGKLREQRVVEAVVNWVASNVHYADGVQNPPESAADVLRYREAICTGYANLTAGMLRSLGIPTQVVFGLVAGKPIDLQGMGGRAIGWGVGSSSGEMHAWLNVYFPDAGWVPLDPQLEKFFIDTRHVAFESNPDAGATGMATWTAQAAPGANPAGHLLSNGSVAIAPADGISSRVSVQIQDRLDVELDSSRPDVQHTVLFSR